MLVESELSCDSDDPTTVDSANNPKVNWSALQGLFLDECDSCVLFLLDCCFAASAVQYTDGNSVVEAVVAAGFNRVAPLQGTDSFTRFLTDVLKDRRNSKKPGVYVARLCSLVTAKLDKTDLNRDKGTSRRVTPHHIVFSNQASVIYLCPLDKSVTLESPPLQLEHRPTIRATPIAEPPYPESESTAQYTLSRGAILPLSQPHTEPSNFASSTGQTSLASSLAPSRARSPTPSDLSSSKKRDFWDWRSERPYRQVPLGHMRLLHLHPSPNKSDAITCSFSIHPIEACELPYSAISHVWVPDGIFTQNDIVQIADGDHVYPVKLFANQYQALKQIRHTSQRLNVWLDAICIHQSNLVEKNEQVNQMPTIFRQATEVIVWLGTGDEASQTAMTFVPRLIDLTNFDKLLKDEETPNHWQALVKLLENPYFGRRWVFLELILARRAIVRCGDKEVPWEDFCDAILLLGSRFEEIQLLCKRFAITEK